ncbi:hypothetical protein JXA88_11335 [Candidatus Fermentibacteria bacterium]|nr:hypothetical protein [Candidatus Fermentibacteria bacterium]
MTRFFAILLLLIAHSRADERWVSFAGEGEPAGIAITMLSNDLSGCVYEVGLGGMWVEDIEHEGGPFQRLRLPSSGRTADVGLPEIPYVGRFIGLPRGAAVSASIAVLDSVILEGFRVWPAQEPVPDLDGAQVPFIMDNGHYRGGQGFPAERLLVSQPYTVRGLQTALVGVFPLRFYAETSRLVAYTRCRVDVRFTGGAGFFVPQRLRSRFFEPLYAGMLLNYDQVGGVSPLPAVREGEGELLIIVPDGFSEAVQPLVQWRRMSGIPTVMVTRTQAGWDAEGIRAYVQTAYETWETPPSFVLLVGDADLMPTNYLYTHPYHGTLTGTDLWYATVDGDDYFADIHHGRISVDSATQSGPFAKILGYEQNPPAGGWNNHVFLAAYDEAGRYFVTVSNMIYDYLISLGFDVTRAYEAGTPPGSTADVIANFNAGSFIVNHRDHGDTDGWSHPSFTLSHFAQLANGAMLPVVYSLNCLTGYFDSETDSNSSTFESFCEELLRLSPGGAVGVVGATRVSYSGYNDELVKGIYDAMWPGFDPSYPGGTSQNPWGSPTYRQGVVVDFAKWWMYDKYVLTNGAGYPWAPDPTTTRTEMEMFHYYGDPTQDIHTAEPAAMVVNHDAASVVGVTSFTVLVDTDGAMAAMSRDGDLLGRALVSGGTAHIIFDEPPTIPGPVDLVVSAHNRIPYQGTVQLAPAEGWYVVIDSLMAVDTFGTVNGIVEQGDSVALDIRLWNVGQSEAPPVTGTLSSGDGMVAITDAVQGYGSMAPDATAQSTGPYRLAVAGGAADNHVVPFELALSSGDSAWIRQFAMVLHAPVLQIDSVAVDDAGGNGNGRADPGETVDLYVYLRNTGSGSASSVQGTVASTHPDVTVGFAIAPFPSLNPGGSETNAQPFVISVGGECPEGAVAAFSVQVDALGPWQATLPFTLVLGQPTVLVVDTDDEPIEGRLLDAMNASGYSFDWWDVPAQGSVPLAMLSLYPVVVWTAGDQNVSSMSPTDQQTLATYLDGGGALLFSAENYLTSYGSSSFTSTYLHVASSTTSITVNEVRGVPADPITAGMVMPTDFPAGMSEYPDAIVPDAGAAGILTVGTSAQITALRYPASGQTAYRVVFMATPFEALTSGQAPPSQPLIFLQQALAWLLDGADGVPPEGIVDLGIMRGVNGEDVVLTWSAPWDNVGVTEYRVYRSVIPHFTPGPWSLLTTVQNPPWTDEGGAGDPELNWVYVVTARDASGNEGPASNRVGETDFLTPTGP